MKPRQTLAERLAGLIDKHAGGVVRRFAQAIGVNHQAVHNWLAGERQPNAKALVAIWQVYRVDPLWLLTGAPSIQAPVVLRVAPPRVGKADRQATAEALETELERERFMAVPLLTEKRVAAHPREVRPPDIEDFVAVHADWLPTPEMTTCVRVPDDAMAPILSAGAIVAVDHGQREAKRLDGAMAAFRVGEAVAIRWCRLAAPDLLLGLPENRAGSDRAGVLIYHGHDIADALLGRVVGWWGRPAD
jgi:transcriptional regulator with XRE-family HTH domain